MTTQTINSDQNYHTIVRIASVIAIPGGIFAVLQFFTPHAGSWAKIGDILTCTALLILWLSQRFHRLGRWNNFLFDAIGSLTLALIFTLFLVAMHFHPSAGDGDEVAFYILPAILLFLTQSYMALVRFQISD